MEKFGDYLKTQREKKSIRLEEIASITKIHLHSLELLETNRWDQLPPEPFIRGFIIAYAKYVGLDPKDTLSKYLQAVGQTPVDGTITLEPTKSSREENPSDVIQNAWQLPVNKIFVGAGAFAVIALVGVFIAVGKKNAAPEGAVTVDTATGETLAAENARANGGTGIVDNHGHTAGKGPSEDSRSVASPAKVAEAAKPVEAAPTTAPAPPVNYVMAPKLTETKVAELPPASPERISLTPIPLTGGQAPVVEKPVEKPKEVAKEVKKEKKVAAVETAVVPPLETEKPDASADAASEEFKHQVEVEGQDRTWIKIVVDDKPPVEFFLPKGEKATYQAKTKIKVVLGNSTGSKVVHNGEVSKGKKFQGTIRYYIFPSNARFPQDVPSKRATSSRVTEGEETDPAPKTDGTEGE